MFVVVASLILIVLCTISSFLVSVTRPDREPRFSYGQFLARSEA